MADRERVESLFIQALALEGEERDAFLRRTCGDDRELRSRVEALIDSSGGSDEAPTMPHQYQAESATGAGAGTEEAAGAVIGQYRLLQKLGEGGFGTVWLAQQQAPIKRRVALKIIKLGMDTQQVIARFEAERQALALLDHPNIAKVFDAGSSSAGRPFFVMELVKGVSILKYCDSARLDTRSRLDLFVKVCHALQHAHHKGIIHRDIKPSNILVTLQEGNPEPKIIDFGIAKATNAELTQQTFFTEFRQLIGTPAYMSPEQADQRGLDIDTRSDIYSLGVLLYELLTGATPFDMEVIKEGGYAEVLRILRETEPPKPSARVSALVESAVDVAAARRTEARQLAALLRRDLDWIVLKCLERDRNRRYETANALAMDIRRFLSHEPVLAGPPSMSYRMGKFVRRNRVAVAAASLVAALFVLGVVGTTWGLVRALQEKARATEALEELEQVTAFQARQLSGLDTSLMGERIRAEVEARHRAAMVEAGFDERAASAATAELEGMLDAVNFTDVALTSLDENVFERALSAIERDFADRPLIKARLLETVADTLRRLGLLERAMAPQQEALDIRRRLLGEDHLDTLLSLNSMGGLLLDQGRLVEAESRYREAHERFWNTVGRDHPETIGSIINVGGALREQGKLSEAEPFYRDALDRSRRVLGGDHETTLIALNNLGGLLLDLGRLAEAEPYHREVLEKNRRLLGNEHARTLISINNMGFLLQRLGRYAEAEPFYREALDQRRRLLGEQHPRTLTSLNNLGVLLRDQGRFGEAEDSFRRVLDGCRRVLGEEHPTTLSSLANLGVVVRDQGRFGEAETHLKEALEKRRRVLGEEHPSTLQAMDDLGVVMHRQERWEQAEGLLREALERRRRFLGGDHPRTLASIDHVAVLLLDRGRSAEAEPYCREALEARVRVLGGEHPETLVSIATMGRFLLAVGRYGEAVALLAEHEQASRRFFTEGNAPRLASLLVSLGRARVRLGAAESLAAAEEPLLEAHSLFSETWGESHRSAQDAALALAELYGARHAAEPTSGHDLSAGSWWAMAEAAASGSRLP